jgi:Holliday junction resolvasome RuvABC endonuclease subunit
MRNWGIATGNLCVKSGELTIINLAVTNPVLPSGKQVRQNSKDLVAAEQLAAGAWAAVKDAQAIFVEVPVGSQSARAMASYGICTGILGSMRANGIPFFEVTPTEVKLAAVNNKNATKRQMINWATELYHYAPWPTQTQKGVIRVVEGKAEHMADAIAAIHAGVKTQMFQQTMMLRA